MKNREVMEKILAFPPAFPAGRASNVNVVKKASALGANLIIVHEPTFYTSADKGGWYEDFPNAVYEAKKELIDSRGIAIWRDHGHMRFHSPDSAFTGMIKYLGW